MHAGMAPLHVTNRASDQPLMCGFVLLSLRNTQRIGWFVPLTVKHHTFRRAPLEPWPRRLQVTSGPEWMRIFRPLKVPLLLETNLGLEWQPKLVFDAAAWPPVNCPPPARVRAGDAVEASAIVGVAVTAITVSAVNMNLRRTDIVFLRFRFQVVRESMIVRRPDNPVSSDNALIHGGWFAPDTRLPGTAPSIGHPGHPGITEIPVPRGKSRTTTVSVTARDAGLPSPISGQPLRSSQPMHPCHTDGLTVNCEL